MKIAPISLIFFSLTLIFTQSAIAERKAKVHFISPKDGATVSSPFKVQMGVVGMAVEKAGTMKAGTGHHHIIINSGHIKWEQVIPSDEKHIHFGGGQTKAELKLPPGKHTLTLQFADGAHRSYGKELSETIQITVK